MLSHEEYKTIYIYSPTLAGLLSAISMEFKIHELFSVLVSINKISFPSNEKSVIEEKSEDQYTESLSKLPSYKSDINKDILTLWDTGTYFPLRRVYRTIEEIDIGIQRREESCNKNYKKKGTLAPGILWFFCGQHNKCVGFVVLESSESCKTVSEIIITRFEQPPDIIIYDNSCNLEQYVLNRWPNYFQNTTFYVDGFHYKSHKNCATTYDSGLHSSVISTINTSLVEQKNARIRHIKNTTPLMKARTFMSKLIYIVSYINKNN